MTFGKLKLLSSLLFLDIFSIIKTQVTQIN